MRKHGRELPGYRQPTGRGGRVGWSRRALETWAQSAPPGAIDPLILAFEDKDERVRARAQQLIEQDWERKAEAEK